MIITYNLLSTQVPSPTAPPANLTVGNGTGGPFATGMTQGVSQLLNKQAAKVQILAQLGSGGSGVVNGLDVSAGTGLTLEVSAGTAYAGDVISTSSTMSLVLPDNSPFVFIWLSSQGTLAWNQNYAIVPSGGMVFLGTVTTATGAITAMDYSGRVSIQDGQRWRKTNDSISPADSPPSNCRVFTQTPFGTFYWNGSAQVLLHDLVHQSLDPYRVSSLQNDIALQISDANIQWLIANGAARNVSLPTASALVPGIWFEIVNAGDAGNSSQNYNILLKDSGGNLIATIPPGQSVRIRPLPGASGVGSVWPSSVTPSTPS